MNKNSNQYSLSYNESCYCEIRRDANQMKGTNLHGAKVLIDIRGIVWAHLWISLPGVNIALRTRISRRIAPIFTLLLRSSFGLGSRHWIEGGIGWNGKLTECHSLPLLRRLIWRRKLRSLTGGSGGAALCGSRTGDADGDVLLVRHENTAEMKRRRRRGKGRGGGGFEEKEIGGKGGTRAPLLSFSSVISKRFGFWILDFGFRF